MLITGCSQLLTPVDLRPAAAKRSAISPSSAMVPCSYAMASFKRWARAAKLSDSASRVAPKTRLGRARGAPGFVDSHTHLIFPASRAAEYEQRIAGATYEEIARAGGGSTPP